MRCVLKTTQMIKQVQEGAQSGSMTKITIENFQKRDRSIFTSEKSTVELDNKVK